MTLVEFFSKNQIENLMGTLFFKPVKTIFVSFENSVSESDKSAIEKYIKLKKINTRIEFINIEKHCFKCAVSTLREICKTNDRCVFDFTGGEELILAAMGFVMSENDICAVEARPFDNLISADLQNDATPIESDITNTIEENFVMYGAMIDKRKLKPEKQFLSENTYEEIYPLFDICRKNPSMWNSTCITLNSLEDSYFPKSKENVTFNRLVQNRFIIINRETKNSYSISYKNKFTELCLSDPGTILELYTYHILKKSGKFSDVGIGVTVDWDGLIHRDFQKTMDTSNEIDVIAMKGLRPAYISCKNGKVTKETLYELETVSNRFGGKYAVKVLVAPILKLKNPSNKYILSRADDMGIKVITDISGITDSKLISIIEGAFLEEGKKK